MPIFPNTEKEAANLCSQVLEGLRQSPKLFPNTSEQTQALREAFETYCAAKSAQRRQRAAYAEATEKKNDALAELLPLLKEAIKTAEADCEETPSALRLLGWGPPKPRGRPRKENGAPPDAPSSLEASLSSSTPGRARLRWKPSPEGDQPTHYEIMRRVGQGSWELAGTLSHKPAQRLKIALDDQPLHSPLAYRVIAVNRWGRSNAGPAASIIPAKFQSQMEEEDSASEFSMSDTTIPPSDDDYI